VKVGAGRVIQSMSFSSPNARDAALALITRINGWLIAGALVASGLLSLVAAHAFPSWAFGQHEERVGAPGRQLIRAPVGAIGAFLVG